jgi:hypothetical protein
MWTKIDKTSIFESVIKGDIITDNPDNPHNQYQIVTKVYGFVKALHANGKTAIRIFPEEELMNGKWWVKI